MKQSIRLLNVPNQKQSCTAKHFPVFDLRDFFWCSSDKHLFWPYAVTIADSNLYLPNQK